MSAGDVDSLEQAASPMAATTIKAVRRMQSPTCGRRRYTGMRAPVQSHVGRWIRLGVKGLRPRLPAIDYRTAATSLSLNLAIGFGLRQRIRKKLSGGGNVDGIKARRACTCPRR